MIIHVHLYKLYEDLSHSFKGNSEKQQKCVKNGKEIVFVLYHHKSCFCIYESNCAGSYRKEIFLGAGQGKEHSFDLLYVSLGWGTGN